MSSRFLVFGRRADIFFN